MKTAGVGVVAGAVLLGAVAVVSTLSSGIAYTPNAHDADVNRDGAINSADLAHVARCFFFNPSTPVPCFTDTPPATSTLVPTATNTPPAASTPTPVATATRTAAANNPTPNDPQFNSQWNLQKIRAPLAWEFGHGRAAIKVALLDTGVAPLPDLAANLGPGINLVGVSTCGPATDTCDDFSSYGSGTQSASIIGAVGNNARDLAGVNWTITILPVKVRRYDGSGPTQAIADGIDWALANGAQIIQISPALTGPSADIDAAVARALAANVIVVAASGNIASHVGYPASIAGVVAVGATDSIDAVGGASGRGPELDLTAPGVLVPVIVTGGCCAPKTATELGAAHITGAIALMLAAGISDPVGKLERTAVDLGAAGRDDVYGFGRIDLYAGMLAP